MSACALQGELGIVSFPFNSSHLPSLKLQQPQSPLLLEQRIGARSALI